MYFTDHNSEGFDLEITETTFKCEVISFGDVLHSEVFDEDYLDSKIESITEKFKSYECDIIFTHYLSGNEVFRLNNH